MAITPADSFSTAATSITVAGTASDTPSGIATVTVNGIAASVDSGAGTFSASDIALACGANSVTAVATDNSGRTTSSAITVTRTCASYSASYLGPLAPSSSSGITANKIKNGRALPVKIEIYSGSDEYDGTNAAPQISVRGVACGGGSAWAASPEYADEGAANSSANEFRWSGESEGFWIYNLDTKALGWSVGNCYRLDVALGETTISTAGWLLVEVTK